MFDYRRKPRIWLCLPEQYNDVAGRLLKNLAGLDFHVEDPRTCGELKSQRDVERLIRKSDVVLLMSSPAAHASQQVIDELQIAKRHRIPIISYPCPDHPAASFNSDQLYMIDAGLADPEKTTSLCQMVEQLVRER